MVYTIIKRGSQNPLLRNGCPGRDGPGNHHPLKVTYFKGEVNYDERRI